MVVAIFICLSSPIKAQYSISNVIFDKSSPAAFGHGTTVNLSFDYTKLDGDALIFARPFINGANAPFSSASPSATYSDNQGSGIGSFTLSVNSEVDQVRFQILEKATFDLLHETFIEVDYRWLDCATNTMLTIDYPITTTKSDFYASEMISFLPGFESSVGQVIIAGIIACNE